jgi:hypothetical protein
VEHVRAGEELALEAGRYNAPPHIEGRDIPAAALFGSKVGGDRPTLLDKDRPTRPCADDFCHVRQSGLVGMKEIERWDVVTRCSAIDLRKERVVPGKPGCEDHIIDGFVGVCSKPDDAVAEAGHGGANDHASGADGVDDATIENRDAVEEPMLRWR